MRAYLVQYTAQMSQITIQSASSPNDAAELDELLWRTLWQPLGLPRNVRDQFKLEGDSLELLARENGRLIGGLVAVWTSDTQLELRHLAVEPQSQNHGIARQLIDHLIEIVRPKGCRRIHTIARNTSIAFFKKLGFTNTPDAVPDHPLFKKHGITFQHMEKFIEVAL